MQPASYAVITGSSEGFGKALALECASRKINIVLAALPGKPLINLAEFIRQNYDVQVVAVGCDLAEEKGCYELYEKVMSENIPIQMLINNAGVGSNMLFEEGEVAFLSRQVRLNLLCATVLTRLFLPHLKEHKHSFILNVSSLANFFSMPNKAVYGATKSYMYAFSKNLSTEEAQHGVKICAICPGGMNTNLSLTLNIKNGDWLTRQSTLNPEVVAKIAISSLLKGKKVAIPGIINKFFMFLDVVLPPVIKKKLISQGIKKVKPSPVFFWSPQ